MDKEFGEGIAKVHHSRIVYTTVRSFISPYPTYSTVHVALKNKYEEQKVTTDVPTGTVLFEKISLFVYDCKSGLFFSPKCGTLW